MDTQERRQELSSFLKQRRDRITPEAVGLPSGTRRRTPGLRREEVAQLAGVGATWYTWLEQGRDIRVSAQVLDSVARVLQLSEVERTYLFELVRDEPPPVPVESATQVNPTLQLVLDNQQCCPAYVMSWRWDVLAWNHLACLALIDFENLPDHERNILWLMYLNDEFRSRQPNWQRACQETLAHFRASCAPYIGNPEFTDLIERLKDKSLQFKEHWRQLDVSQKRDSFKEFNHPSLGQLKFEMVMLQVNAFPGIQLVLFVPVADATRKKLEQLEAKGAIVMNRAMNPPTQLWVLPQFDNLEVFRAKAIHYHYARHFHASYAIGVIEAGVGGNYYQGATYLAPAHSIVLMNPEEAHTGFSAEGLPLTYRMIYPSVTCTAAIASELQGSGTPYFQNSVVQDKRLAQQVLALCVTLEQPQELLVQQTRFVEVLSTLLKRYARINSRLLEDGQEHRAVGLIKDYLHDNFRASISLAQLAEVTNLNCSYLVRVFRDAVGMPPYTYLNQIRVEKAKQCLRQGMAIADTAIAVGMTDQSHLNRHFKRIVGISPGQYRTMSTSFKTEQA